MVKDASSHEPVNLGKGWVGFDYEDAFGKPTKVVNDAAMQALGSYDGGRMLFLGLGTGLGSAMIVDGVSSRWSSATCRTSKATFEDYVGERGARAARQEAAGARPSPRSIERLVAALEPDYVVLGGGNAEARRAPAERAGSATTRTRSSAGSGSGSTPEPAVSEGGAALDAGATEPASPGAVRRIVLVVGWLCAVALVVLVLHLLGVDVEGWFTSLWDALIAVDPEDVVLGLGLQTLDTLLSAIAWLAILRAAYPCANIEALPIVTAYAVAVAGNDVLPASLGTLVMLVMLAAIIPGATFPGLVGGQVVHKLFFVAAGAFVYLYLFLSVPGSFSLQLGLVADHPSRSRSSSVSWSSAWPLVRALWSRLRGLWARAKQGGAILGDTRAFVLKVLLPELGAWICRLGVIGVFLAAYGIPVTFHTIMSVAGGNSLANVVSVTPGGAGVNQAVNSAALTHEDVDRATALAYSAGQQLITTAWSLGLAVILVAVTFGLDGWQAARQAVVRGSTGAHRPSRRIADLSD